VSLGKYYWVSKICFILEAEPLAINKFAWSSFENASEFWFQMHSQFHCSKVRLKSACLQTMHLGCIWKWIRSPNRIPCVKMGMLVYIVSTLSKCQGSIGYGHFTGPWCPRNSVRFSFCNCAYLVMWWQLDISVIIISIESVSYWNVYDELFINWKLLLVGVFIYLAIFTSSQITVRSRLHQSCPLSTLTHRWEPSERSRFVIPM